MRFTFTTKYLGQTVTSGRTFSTRDQAWEAARDWADVCYENGEAVYVRVDVAR